MKSTKHDIGAGVFVEQEPNGGIILSLAEDENFWIYLSPDAMDELARYIKNMKGKDE